MTINVGEVIAVKGVSITLKIYDESNKDVLFHKGEKFKGISIREYVTIQRGFKHIVCMVQGEYLDESKFEKDGVERIFWIRKVDVKPIGYFDNDVFIEGIKYLPMIKDLVFLASEEQIKNIYGKKEDKDKGFVIGELLKEGLAVSLPWKKLFNSHIGIFGNTGSGKSNTLTNLYTTLFKQKKENIQGRSKFVVLDFNGEYTKNQLVDGNNKKVYNLSTKNNDGDKFPINSNEFWNADTLCLLFKATPNTQTPFIKRVVNGRKKYGQNANSLTNYVKATFEKNFKAQSQKRETVDLLTSVSKVIDNEELSNKLSTLSWHGQGGYFYIVNGPYFNGGDSPAYANVFQENVANINIQNLSFFQELILRINLQLVNDLLSGYVQFEHIQPLLKRIEALALSLAQIIEVKDNIAENRLLTVISLRQCNQEVKKVIPLLVAKHFYEGHKSTVGAPPDKTVHLIIDEAHNVLSQQSLREEESWKDYRLELFEEIIKEGRKFGFYLTLSSQRPADISPTIMSQVHNFFIHRLVNDRDLFLLDNTISTLDSLSKSMIPNLSKGSCIVTGTAFDLPLLIQVNLLVKEQQPDSEDVDLEVLWE
ncbi:ATP-binding protein [Methylotenera sp.]|uniref:ATP-binding protein n=1 Tax=Methylotenera sp. TaxID=2051956 RepID=UPI0027371F29|nr:ATP-binding protein [Methylotenera sp.]MDP3778399.1 ATP-binding protein [Methylotenera sp.]